MHRMRSHPKLIHIRLPYNNSTRIAELLNDRRIIRARKMLQDSGAGCCREIGGTNVVLDGYDMLALWQTWSSPSALEERFSVDCGDEGIEVRTSMTVSQAFFGVSGEGH